MVKVAAADLPHVIDKFVGAFDSLWADPEFEDYRPDHEDDRRRLTLALGHANGDATPGPTTFFDLRPYPYQQKILDDLDAERSLHGRYRNLVVAATGTGKTVIAALDYARRAGPIRPRLLFVAHRMDILQQALDTFRHALRDEAFGELLGEGHTPRHHDHVFAMVQTLARHALPWPPDHFDHVVIDECHHVPAPSYRTLIHDLKPKVLVGLTATPERSDGAALQPDFDNHIAAEIRLWHAVERQLLVPFEYFGLADGTDLRDVRWSRGSYDAATLWNVYDGNDRRADLIAAKVMDHAGTGVRALAFCVSIAHAEQMTAAFLRAGIPAAALHGEHDRTERDAQKQRLRTGEIKVLFTCDLFNEGVDLPWLNTVLLLRPTESATLFLQQIGRGLRHHPGKSSCLVLDFVGQHRAEFRFDRLLEALTGVPRGRLRAEVAADFPTLPAGCALVLDHVVRDTILTSLAQSLAAGRARLAREARLANAPTLAAFLDTTGRDLADVYQAGGWTTIRRAAGMLPPDAPEGEAALAKRLKLLLHTDDADRTTAWRTAAAGSPPADDRAARHQLMLGYQLFHEHSTAVGAATVAEALAPYGELRSELLELADVVDDRLDRAASYPVDGWTLALHHSYGRREILAAVGASRKGYRGTSREGVYRLPKQRAELFFVTLDKSVGRFAHDAIPRLRDQLAAVPLGEPERHRAGDGSRAALPRAVRERLELPPAGAGSEGDAVRVPRARAVPVAQG